MGNIWPPLKIEPWCNRKSGDCVIVLKEVAAETTEYI